MDSFDDFEMKPLTAGLGFHKKSVSLKESAQKVDLSEEKTKRFIPQPPPEDVLDKKLSFQLPQLDIKESSSEKQKMSPDIEISEPLPRKSPAPSPLHDKEDINNIFEPQIKDKEIISSSTRRGGHNAPTLKNIEPYPFSPLAVLVDALVVVALVLLFLLSLLFVTEANLVSVYRNAQQDFFVQLSAATLFVSVWLIYSLVSRSFYGKTFGEWVFDLQLGDEEQQRKVYYPFLVLWRHLVILMTGLITLPLLSFIFRKDLAGYFSGLSLYKKKVL
ncbi:MAG: hypothetical protein D6797_00115 [Bdellovibrio sp.]|nr:MAG: hypothetical protein D6797_00115 [Bdellovibrio sp.]